MEISLQRAGHPAALRRVNFFGIKDYGIKVYGLYHLKEICRNFHAVTDSSEAPQQPRYLFMPVQSHQALIKHHVQLSYGKRGLAVGLISTQATKLNLKSWAKND